MGRSPGLETSASAPESQGPAGGVPTTIKELGALIVGSGSREYDPWLHPREPTLLLRDGAFWLNDTDYLGEGAIYLENASMWVKDSNLTFHGRGWVLVRDGKLHVSNSKNQQWDGARALAPGSYLRLDNAISRMGPIATSGSRDEYDIRLIDPGFEDGQPRNRHSFHDSIYEVNRLLDFDAHNFSANSTVLGNHLFVPDLILDHDPTPNTYARGIDLSGITWNVSTLTLQHRDDYRYTLYYNPYIQVKNTPIKGKMDALRIISSGPIHNTIDTDNLLVEPRDPSRDHVDFVVGGMTELIGANHVLELDGVLGSMTGLRNDSVFPNDPYKSGVYGNVLRMNHLPHSIIMDNREGMQCGQQDRYALIGTGNWLTIPLVLTFANDSWNNGVGLGLNITYHLTRDDPGTPYWKNGESAQDIKDPFYLPLLDTLCLKQGEPPTPIHHYQITARAWEQYCTSFPPGTTTLDGEPWRRIEKLDPLLYRDETLILLDDTICQEAKNATRPE